MTTIMDVGDRFMHNISDYDYHLPEELIAQEPLKERDQSRLMVLHRDTGEVEHKRFVDILEYLNPGDALIINETKVMPARIYGEREDTGARIEVLLLKQIKEGQWEVLVNPGRKAKKGDVIVFKKSDQVVMKAAVMDITETGERIFEFSYQGDFMQLLDDIGVMPLPPYIRKKLEDKDRYQTVYAKKEGSAAAPTAGLHFTPRLLEKVQQKGVKLIKILLHVGLGTFKPVKVEDIRKHRMHAEYYEVSEEAARTINETKRSGGRIVAVGTTSVRTLETVADKNGFVKSEIGWTDVYIYPGYEFKCVDALITNFHLPKSTLIMMISAFAGREKVLNAYNIAVKERYRFFSFGDAMLII